jgi:hypothetical protein
MNKILTIAICLFAYAATASAQKFMDRIEKDVEGQGTVRIYQDSMLTRIINGDTIPTINKENEGTGKKVKKRGFRIQVFRGGHTRADEAKARSTGERVRKIFKLSAYTIYSNPNWVCHVGDFKSRDEALEYLPKIKNVARTAMIVPSVIYVRE